MTTHDSFAHVPATPGSYGLAPADFRLPEATRVGHVELQVADLERSVRYYSEVIGLRVVEASGAIARLGAQEDDGVLVVLREQPAARRADARPHLGLFHFAILLPSRAALGRFVRHVSTQGVRMGAGDHLVSEAFYLTDPDGLGIEVYADRPRETWRRRGRELVMGTAPVDVRDVMAAGGAEPWSGAPAGTTMGHVHLHVGDLEAAAAFYGDAIGFDRMVWTYPGALFFGAGGYHHHLGTNTWAGSRATTPGPDDARLLAWTLVLPDEASVAAVRASVEAAGHAAADVAGGFSVADPWGARLVLHARNAAMP